MNECVEAFLGFLSRERRLSDNTLSAYRNDLRQFEEYLCSDRAARLKSTTHATSGAVLIEAGRTEVVDFFLQLRENGYSPATIARKMAAVKSLFQYLYSRGQIASNPALSLGSPEVKKPLPRAISVEDVDSLLRYSGGRETPEGLRDAAMLQVLCATGMRVTELVSLDLADVDLVGRRIYCTGRNARRRELPVDERVVSAVVTYLELGRPQLVRGEDSGLALFLNHRGKRLTRQGFWLIMKALTRQSGLTSEVTPHTLRHSFAAHRLKDGLELHRLRELLGHANISTTQIYTQVRLGSEVGAGSAARPDPVGAGS